MESTADDQFRRGTAAPQSRGFGEIITHQRALCRPLFLFCNERKQSRRIRNFLSSPAGFASYVPDDASRDRLLSVCFFLGGGGLCWKRFCEADHSKQWHVRQPTACRGVRPRTTVSRLRQADGSRESLGSLRGSVGLHGLIPAQPHREDARVRWVVARPHCHQRRDRQRDVVLTAERQCAPGLHLRCR